MLCLVGIAEGPRTRRTSIPGRESGGAVEGAHGAGEEGGQAVQR